MDFKQAPDQLDLPLGFLIDEIHTMILEDGNDSMKGKTAANIIRATPRLVQKYPKHKKFFEGMKEMATEKGDETMTGFLDAAMSSPFAFAMINLLVGGKVSLD